LPVNLTALSIKLCYCCFSDYSKNIIGDKSYNNLRNIDAENTIYAYIQQLRE